MCLFCYKDMKTVKFTKLIYVENQIFGYPAPEKV
jgi:hypothetical protein